jgi:uncharacterized protein YjiS (DUF1127 family)
MLLIQIYDALRRWRLRASLIADLHRLDDNLLHDIGLRRDQIEAFVDAMMRQDRARGEAGSLRPRARHAAAGRPAAHDPAARPCCAPG